ncbi:SRPBCC family protein [Aliiroseovarius lamellibrachiae]|uniref:SRPBCC family protein n=1 Tax=Aliiroseovarius lamellibrachiae TaxID=1924933 RepID=UPI001BDF81FF|nr:SRPBCC domain-containing protein [Aliiroseovarius lamellibrachiae]MBT2130488.1 SRPBCC domain-containing protein [Aliiroseovarius lamellibrachiae]
MLAKLSRILAPIIFLSMALIALYVGALALSVDTVSIVFLLGFPFIAGAVIVHFRPKGTFRSFGASVLFLAATMLGSFTGSFVFKLEGLICIAMAIAPLLGASMIGGLTYLIYLRWKTETKGAKTVFALPLVAIFCASLLPSEPKTYVISHDVLIDAPAEKVFEMVKSIPDIQPSEVPTHLSHWLGVPKPTSAVWTQSPAGSVRHSFWGEDVHFLERITEVVENRRISWVFEFPKGWAAQGIEDPHIEVGGRYFDVLSGSYQINSVGDKTRLTLTTQTYDGSKLGWYAKFWHNFFFEDFHQAILSVIKTRAEA